MIFSQYSQLTAAIFAFEKPLPNIPTSWDASPWILIPLLVARINSPRPVLPVPICPGWGDAQSVEAPHTVGMPETETRIVFSADESLRHRSQSAGVAFSFAFLFFFFSSFSLSHPPPPAAALSCFSFGVEDRYSLGAGSTFPLDLLERPREWQGIKFSHTPNRCSTRTLLIIHIGIIYSAQNLAKIRM